MMSTQKEDSEPSQAQPQPQAQRPATAVMNVLGRDGNDMKVKVKAKEGLLVDEEISTKRQQRPAALFWKTVSEKAQNLVVQTNAEKEDEDVSARYKSVQDEESGMEETPPTQKSSVLPKKSKRIISPSVKKKVSKSHQFEKLSTSDDIAVPPSREDKVHQECAFFYQDLDEETQGASLPNGETRNSKGKTPKKQKNLPPRYRAAYRARFQQLNDYEPIELESDDLVFEDEDTVTSDSSPHLPRVTDVSNSSLCWKQDGRILMKLPKDKVRLLMDPQLEPGILSVEDASFERKENAYVLTVDENLYRRVVEEIADAYSSPCGVHEFCLDEGRVNIWVAVLLLVVILIFLLVNTIIWPVS